MFEDRKNLNIAHNEVHIWIVREEIQSDAIEFEFLLSDFEQERKKKFRFNADRNTFITGRVALKQLLSNYSGKNPHDIIFDYNSQGKPFLSNSEFQFNLSNTRTSIAIAITKNCDVGIDLEFNKNPIEIDQIASDFFSKNEVNKLSNLPNEERLLAFYNCWTRKEAFIKAKGGGLSIPLDQFEVEFLPGEAPKILDILWERHNVPNWSMHAFSWNQDYTGAVVVHNKQAIFRMNQFEKEHLLMGFSSTKEG